MTREEYIQQCKARARVYVERGELANAVASMMSDLAARDDTRDVNEFIAAMGLLAAQKGSRRDVSRFIEGFN